MKKLLKFQQESGQRDVLQPGTSIHLTEKIEKLLIDHMKTDIMIQVFQ